jgi:hypothetical protein
MSAVSEIASIRACFVDAYVQRRINHREGDCTTDQIVGWENQAYAMWRHDHPALSEMLPSHLPANAEVAR